MLAIQFAYMGLVSWVNYRCVQVACTDSVLVLFYHTCLIQSRSEVGKYSVSEFKRNNLHVCADSKGIVEISNEKNY